MNATNSDIVNLTQKLNEKQEKLESGVNIRFINGESILGQGNLVTMLKPYTYKVNLDDTYSYTPVRDGYTSFPQDKFFEWNFNHPASFEYDPYSQKLVKLPFKNAILLEPGKYKLTLNIDATCGVWNGVRGGIIPIIVGKYKLNSVMSIPSRVAGRETILDISFGFNSGDWKFHNINEIVVVEVKEPSLIGIYRNFYPTTSYSYKYNMYGENLTGAWFEHFIPSKNSWIQFELVH